MAHTELRIFFGIFQNTTIVGVNGNISFKENGDMNGIIVVYQYQSRRVGDTRAYTAVLVGRSDTEGNNLMYLDFDSMDWNSFSQKESGSITVPESNCGPQCVVGEYAVQLVTSCCWLCKPCPANGDVSNHDFSLWLNFITSMASSIGLRQQTGSAESMSCVKYRQLCL